MDWFELAERCLLELGALLGLEGYRALVTRALRLASAEYPFLEGAPSKRSPRSASADGT